jgi:hypothetical protein
MAVEDQQHDERASGRLAGERRHRVGAAVRAFALLAALGACSVPALSLDGKQCPCVEAGYVCDTQTNRCLATNDGGMIIDSLTATPCISTVGETNLYRYTGTFDWQHADPAWTGATEILQTSTTAADSYAYVTSSDLTAANNYHVISSMRQGQQGNGMPNLGIVLRAQLSQQEKARYACTWTPKSRTLQIQSFGNMSAVLATVTVSATAAVPTTFTMEASVKGSSISCCIREIEGAGLINAVDPTMAVPMGYPGLTTNRMAAAFGSFVVLKSN